MKSMAVHHDDNGNGLLGILTWIGGIVCMVASNAQTSEIRAWITFSLGAIASIISIIINYPKFRDQVKNWKDKKKKKHGK